MRREFYLRLDDIDSASVVGKGDAAPQEAAPALEHLTESNVIRRFYLYPQRGLRGDFEKNLCVNHP